MLAVLGGIVVIVVSILTIVACGLVALAGLRERYCVMCNRTAQQRLCNNCKPQLLG